jgi:hypothetical protein
MKMVRDRAQETKAFFGDFQKPGTVIGRFIVVIVIVV